MIALTNETIDLADAYRHVQSPLAGAVIVFCGTTREVTDGRRTSSLDYECYPQMAEGKLAELEQSARTRWPLVECLLMHRLGHVPIGEISVAVAVSAAHRQPAFDAARWLIYTLKATVPIWKKENWADGSSQWVHPGLDAIQE